MRILAVIVAVWCVASILIVIGWSRFNRQIADRDVVAAAERILEAAER